MLRDTIELLYTHSLSNHKKKYPVLFFFDTFLFKITTRLKLVINIDTRVEFIYKRKKNPDPKVWNITTA